jgi:hypothetical protein
MKMMEDRFGNQMAASLTPKHHGQPKWLFVVLDKLLQLQ